MVWDVKGHCAGATVAFFFFRFFLFLHRLCATLLQGRPIITRHGARILISSGFFLII